jgi:hypothetical protein
MKVGDAFFVKFFWCLSWFDVGNKKLYSTCYLRDRFFRNPPPSSTSRPLAYAWIRFFVSEDLKFKGAYF